MIRFIREMPKANGLITFLALMISAFGAFTYRVTDNPSAMFGSGLCLGVAGMFFTEWMRDIQGYCLEMVHGKPAMLGKDVERFQ